MSRFLIILYSRMNIFVERLWKSVKYEDIFIKNYTNGVDLQQGLKTYWTFYNTERPHQSLNYQTPKALFDENLKKLEKTIDFINKMVYSFSYE